MDLDQRISQRKLSGARLFGAQSFDDPKTGGSGERRTNLARGCWAPTDYHRFYPVKIGVDSTRPKKSCLQHRIYRGHCLLSQLNQATFGPSNGRHFGVSLPGEGLIARRTMARSRGHPPLVRRAKI